MKLNFHFQTEKFSGSNANNAGRTRTKEHESNDALKQILTNGYTSETGSIRSEGRSRSKRSSAGESWD